MDFTTIQVSRDTRSRLSCFKGSSRESYDEVINKLLCLVPEGDDEGVFSTDFRFDLLNARLDYLSGKSVSHKSVKKQLGL